MRTISTLGVSLSVTLSLMACASGPDNGTEGSSGAPVDAAAVDTAKNDALSAEKDNHEMRKEIFELKGKLGISTEEDSE